MAVPNHSLSLPHSPVKKPTIAGRVERFLRNENNKGYLYISPWFIGFLLFGIAPLVTTIRNSFTSATLFKPGEWVGWENYETLFTSDPIFKAVLSNMLLYLVLAIPLVIGLALFLAVLLNRNFVGNHLFRSIIYIPSLLVGAATGIMFKYVFGGGKVGLVNQLLTLLHLPSIDWVNDSDRLWLAMVGLVILNLWFVGGTMVIFLASMKSISPDYYEAAKIDGANSVHLFRFITLPLIMPTIVFNTIMTLIGQMQIFDMPLIFATSAAGGFSTGGTPLGYKYNLATFVTYLYYRGFVKMEIGYASALAMIVFVLTMTLSIVVIWMARRFSYYGEQEKI